MDPLSFKVCFFDLLNDFDLDSTLSDCDTCSLSICICLIVPLPIFLLSVLMHCFVLSSSKQPRVQFCFVIQSANLFLLISVLSPFTFLTQEVCLSIDLPHYFVIFSPLNLCQISLSSPCHIISLFCICYFL